jgi:hypothetical protein
MANTIKQKRGTTDPAASDLVVGELAINTNDGGVFTKTDGGTVVELGASINLDTSPQLGGDLQSNGHDILMGDEDRIKLGAGSDLQIFHTGSVSKIADSGVGSLVLQTNGAKIQLASLGGIENMGVFNQNGSVDLYYDNVKKFETTNNGIAVTGDIFIGDDDRIKIGDGADLQIFHNVSNGNSTIAESGSGNLNISADNLVIYNSAATETKAKFVSDGAVALYYDNVKKFETTTDGISVTGNVTSSGLNLGDASIYEASGTGDLTFLADSLILSNAADTQVKASFPAAGSVELYYDNSKKFETTDDGVFVSGDIVVGDDNTIKLGAQDDLEIFHNSSNNNSVIKENGSGSLVLAGDNVVIKNTNGTENKAQFNTDAAVKLYHNNVEKFETTSTGISVAGNIAISDDDRINIGTGNDLAIYHSSSNNNSVIQETGSGDLNILANDLNIRNQIGNEAIAKFRQNSSVDLNYNGVKKFETTSTGATITGTCVATEFSGSGASLTGVVKTDATGISGASTVSNIVTISQADYDAISSPDASTIYYITS